MPKWPMVSNSELAPSPKPPVNWPTVGFISGVSIAALWWPLYAWFYGVSAAQVIATVILYIATAMSITVGYHRLLSHQTYKCAAWLEAVLLVVSAGAWQGSALEWTTDHIKHHAFVDTDKDPYNRKRGFWYAHIGWLFRRKEADPSEFPARLLEDRLVMLQHNYYIPLAAITTFVIPFALFGLGGVLLVGAVRVVAVQHVTWFINSWAHTGTRKPYSDAVTAVDNWFLAIVTFGEGWHNYHHTFPSDYRNGIGTFSWDPSKWFIWSFSKIGATSDLRTMSPARVWRRRVDTALAFEGSAEKRKQLCSSTTKKLRALSLRTKERLLKTARAVTPGDEYEMAGLWARLKEIDKADLAISELQELKVRLSQISEKWRPGRSDAQRHLAGKVGKLKELLGHLIAYEQLLERLGQPALQAAV